MPLEIFKVASSAKSYAQEYIKEGNTQLKSDEYSEVQKISLAVAICDIRDKIADINKSNFKKEECYKKKIALIKKYSIGNCLEMARLALYYVLTNYPSLYAEIYEIFNGNHAFLILGKQKPSEPFLWDDEACVCDPWMDKVYLVRERKKHLENYVEVAKEVSEDGKKFQMTKFVNDININRKVMQQHLKDYKDYNGFSLDVQTRKKISLGVIYFFNKIRINTITPIDANQRITPNKNGDNSLSHYYDGFTYRSAKIDTALDLLQLYKSDFSKQAESLIVLLKNQELFKDNSLNATNLLSDKELSYRKECVNHAIMILKDFESHLQDLKIKEGEFGSKTPYISLSIQLQKIKAAVNCLYSLLMGYPATIHVSPIDHEFSETVKKILEAYRCSSSKKEEIAQTEKDFNSVCTFFSDKENKTIEEDVAKTISRNVTRGGNEPIV